MSQLSIRMLGPIQVALNGEQVTDFATDKVRALLAFLAVEADRPHRRESLAGLLWPEQPEGAARASLRRTLADLRASLGDRDREPPFIIATRQSIQLNPAADIWSDVGELTDAQQEQTPVSRLEAIDDLCMGDFLEGLSAPDAAAFEEWSLAKREHLRRQQLATLRRLASHYEGVGTCDKALRYAWKRVEIDRWNEEAHRQLMRLLAQSGDRSAALAQYDSMRRILDEDLGVAPQEASDQLLEQIRSGELRTTAKTEAGAVTGEAGAIGPCPYRGLAAFREADARFFFGREQFVARLIDAIDNRPVVAVIVGSSGSGKSSTVFAGLLPRLRADPDWKIVALRPGAEPFHALAGAVLPELEPELGETDRLIESRRLAGSLRTGEVRLGDAIDRLLGKHAPACRLLLVVDQFEELYTLCPDIEPARRFVDELLATAAPAEVQGAAPLVLLISLRADFMGHALSHRPLADALQDASLMLGPMSRAELRLAIERPAELQGAAFEPGLVDRLLDDVGEEPGNLPLLEFALTLLWEKQSAGLMTHAGYDAIGRVSGALAHYADEVYSSLDDGARRQARLIFGQLVRPGEGTADTRRVAARAQLGDANWALVTHLADMRLVVTGRDAGGEEVVEVVHEALIQSWDRLRTWIDADRAFRTWQEGLRGGLRTWIDTGHDEGALLRGAPLLEAESWQTDRGAELSSEETGFIAASIGLRERTRLESERRRRWTTLALGAGLIVSMVLAGVAMSSRSHAQREADANRSLVLTAAAGDALGRGDTSLALALALEAVDADQPPAEALAALGRIAFAPGIHTVLEGHRDQVRSAALGPLGRWALSGGCLAPGTDGGCTKGELILWDLDAAVEAARFEGHSGWVNDVAFAPDGATALSASDDATLILWAVATGEVVRLFEGHAAGVTAVAFSPAGDIAVSGSDDGTVISWDVGNGEVLRRLKGHTDAITRVAFDTSGDRVLTASRDASLILWQLTTGDILSRFEGHADAVSDAAFHPDGSRILSLGKDLTLRAWDLQTGEELERADVSAEPSRLAITPEGDTILASVKTDLSQWDGVDLQNRGFLVGHQLSPTATGDINALAISTDGELAISAGTDGAVLVWNLRAHGTQPVFAGQEQLNAVAVSEDGSLLLVADWPGEVTLWDIAQRTAVRRFGVEGRGVAPNCLTFGPGSSRVALACAANVGADPEDSSFVMWDLDTGKEIRRFSGHVASLRALAFLPDGRSALAGSQGYPDYSVGDLLHWDLETGRVIRRFDIDHDVIDIALSADGSRAVTSSGTDSVAILWDVATGQEIRRFEGHPTVLLNVAFGPEEESVLAVSWDGSVVVWDLATGELIRRLTGHQAPVWGLDVSPDGRFVVSAAEDGELILWDYATGQERRRIDAHAANAIDVAFHPNGESVFSVGWDGAVIEWRHLDPSLPELLEWIEANRHVRPLTCEEGETYGVALSECG